MLRKRMLMGMVFFAGVIFCCPSLLGASDALLKASSSQVKNTPYKPPQNPVLLRPICEFMIERGAYALIYDGRHRQARVVHEYLTKERVNGPVKDLRHVFPFPFLPDPVYTRKY
jgi:hypothetical protein